MNSLAGAAQVLHTDAGEVHVGAALAAQALQPIDRMLAFTARMTTTCVTGRLQPHTGAA